LKPKLVSVVIPALNAEEHLGEQLAALARQAYRGDWELVVADNGCTDRTVEIVEAWARALPSVTIADASARRGINHARNVGAASARGDFLAFCDADDVVAPGWLEAIASAARPGEVVAGALDFDGINDARARSLCPWDPPAGLWTGYAFLPYVPGGNCGMPTQLAREVGWDESLVFGSSDIDFSWRAQLASYRLRFVPDAVVHQRLPRRLGQLARRFYAYGKSDPALFRRFRDLGMPRPAAEGGASWRWLVRRAPDLLRPGERRAHWVRAAARKSGRIVGSARARVLLL
jgi:glycosyltransferase involved in cell wall biosynthesis